MLPRSRPARALAVAALAAALLAGCAARDGWSGPRTGPTAVGTLGPGFVEPGQTPTPEGTVTPVPDSWDAIHPATGYRVVLVTTGGDDPTKALVGAVQQWAKDEHVDLRTLTVADDDRIDLTLDEAIGMGADLVVAAGDDLVDPLAIVSASHLEQQFLVVGAEIAEPTQNVTAADWAGASYRGEGLGMSSTYDAASFTPQRCADAIRAGVAAVLGGVTGIVVWLA